MKESFKYMTSEQPQWEIKRRIDVKDEKDTDLGAIFTTIRRRFDIETTFPTGRSRTHFFWWAGLVPAIRDQFGNIRISWEDEIIKSFVTVC